MADHTVGDLRSIDPLSGYATIATDAALNAARVEALREVSL